MEQVHTCVNAHVHRISAAISVLLRCFVTRVNRLSAEYSFIRNRELYLKWDLALSSTLISSYPYHLILVVSLLTPRGRNDIRRVMIV